MEKTKSQLKIYHTAPLSSPVLIAGWLTQDIGNVGTGIVNHLQQTRQAEEVAELDPVGFFAFEGAIFKDDVIQIPHSKFMACPRDNLLLFSSDEPMYERYQFLKLVLDFCEEHYGVSRIFSFNGNPSLISHHHPRRIFVVFNQEEVREEIPEGDHIEHTSWEGTPAMSTYLLWMAQNKGICGITLWVEVPFYLSTLEDPRAIKTVLSLLENGTNLELSTPELDQKISQQELMLEELREADTQVNETMQKLEEEEVIEESEQFDLTKRVYDYLKKGK